MKITSGAFLIALLLGLASLSVACASRTINTQVAKETPTPLQGGGRDDSTSTAEWKRYDFDKPLAFSISLPSEPERRVSTFPSQTATSHVFISRSNSGVYGAVYISDLPAVARHWESSGNQFFYEIFIKDFAVKLEGKGEDDNIDFDSHVRFTAEWQVTVSGLEGLERDFSIKDSQGRMQLLRVGQASFCVVAIWKQTATLAERDAFFDSVKIVGEEH